MKIVSFLTKVAASIIIAIIAIALFVLILVSMAATLLIFLGDSTIHIAWAIPTILVVIIAIIALITLIYHGIDNYYD